MLNCAISSAVIKDAQTGGLLRCYTSDLHPLKEYTFCVLFFFSWKMLKEYSLEFMVMMWLQYNSKYPSIICSAVSIADEGTVCPVLFQIIMPYLLIMASLFC